MSHKLPPFITNLSCHDLPRYTANHWFRREENREPIVRQQYGGTEFPVTRQDMEDFKVWRKLGRTLDLRGDLFGYVGILGAGVGAVQIADWFVRKRLEPGSYPDTESPGLFS
jgi:hypothetical protein